MSRRQKRHATIEESAVTSAWFRGFPFGDRTQFPVVLISLGVGIMIGTGAAYFYLQIYSSEPQDAISVREGGYNFINPLLACDISEEKQFTEYQPIADKIGAYIKQHTSNGDAQDISVYFRSLNNGYWSGVNENDAYSPASLLKVPLMIAYLKEADEHRSILRQQITYHQTTDENAAEYYKPQSFIKDGETYSIEDLLKYMIVYSDNNAATLLQNNVNQNSLVEVYSDLGIPVAPTLTASTMTPKIYSYLFRILYNATYLSKPSSQYALELLSAADFPQGIKAGLPENIASSQKFGERSVFTQDASGRATPVFRELHDCGIVYYPRNPYLLCVMTKGNKFETLAHVISDISSLLYWETSKGVLRS